MLKNSQIQGDIRLKHQNGDLTLEIGPAGGRLLFPSTGITNAKFLVAAMTYHGDKLLSFHFEFFRQVPATHLAVENPYKSPEYLEHLKRNMISMTSIFPRNRVVVSFNLALLDGNNLRDLRTPGKLRSMIFGNLIRPDEVVAIGLNILPHHEAQRVTLHELRWAEQEPDYTIQQPVPVVDELGQLTTCDWPGKTPSVAAMIAKQQEAVATAATVEMESPTRSRFGGCKEKRFAATGFFRVEKENGRHYLVDPDGYLFFSMGMVCVGIEDYDTCARIDGIEGLCSWLPPREGDFSATYSSPSDSTLFAEQNPTYFNFAVANLIRAHGPEWRQAWARITHSQLVEWGINTIANWSDPKFIKRAGLPYVTMHQHYATTAKCIFRDFPDVFSPEFQRNAQRYAEQIRPYAGDPLLIGYFMANEPAWGVVQELNIAKEMFRDGTKWHSKAKLMLHLAERFGNVNALNRTWGTNFPDFDSIQNMRYEDIHGMIAETLMDFSRKMMAEYIRVPAEALRSVDPHHLNLGMRYAWIHSDQFYVGAEHFDVFSTNRYAMHINEPPHEGMVEDIIKQTDRPVMIGEFHFGAPDRGCLGSGLKSMKNQEERGKAYRRYVEDAAATPGVLGVHYFILNDQATLGRFDGEANQIGYVDVTGMPYQEFIGHAKTAHENIYPLILGERKPFWCEPEEIPMVF
jgi:hypothetical protein